MPAAGLSVGLASALRRRPVCPTLVPPGIGPVTVMRMAPAATRRASRQGHRYCRGHPELRTGRQNILEIGPAPLRCALALGPGGPQRKRGGRGARRQEPHTNLRGRAPGAPPKFRFWFCGLMTPPTLGRLRVRHCGTVRCPDDGPLGQASRVYADNCTLRLDDYASPANSCE